MAGTAYLASRKRLLQLKIIALLRDDALRQNFAEFHAPLVEGINVPDRALREDAVLVKRHQLAQGFGRELVDQDRVRRAIAFEDAVRDQPVRRAFFLHLFRRLAEREGFGLRENVREEHVVVMADGIQRMREGNKVARDEFSSLMD